MSSALDDTRIFRVYEDRELGPDGYPHVWHRNPQVGPDKGALDHLVRSAASAGRIDFTSGVKDYVRAEAGHRCVRCGHPYEPGCGTWGDGPDVTTYAEDPITARAPTLSALALLDEIPDIPVERAKRETLWSPCDARCTHGGPVRWDLKVREPGIQQGWVGGDLACTVGEAVERDPRMQYQAAWRILTVHHLNGRKADLRWWNLAALCQRCHLHIQKKVVMERVFPLEHTDWFKPHAAAWYAYAYLGADLTKTETLARLDELLDLERMA